MSQHGRENGVTCLVADLDKITVKTLQFQSFKQ